jgi:hypothetical protein
VAHFDALQEFVSGVPQAVAQRPIHRAALQWTGGGDAARAWAPSSDQAPRSSSATSSSATSGPVHVRRHRDGAAGPRPARVRSSSGASTTSSKEIEQARERPARGSACGSARRWRRSLTRPS